MKKSLNIRRLCLYAIVPLLFAAPQIAAQTKNDDIMRLIRLMGVSESMNHFVGTLRQIDPSTPASTWNAYVEELLKQAVPIYAKHYTHEEIKQLIAFYESPVGRKTVQITPVMMQEMMTVAQEWMTRELMKGGRR